MQKDSHETRNFILQGRRRQYQQFTSHVDCNNTKTVTLIGYNKKLMTSSANVAIGNLTHLMTMINVFVNYEDPMYHGYLDQPTTTIDIRRYSMFVI